MSEKERGSSIEEAKKIIQDMFTKVFSAIFETPVDLLVMNVELVRKIVPLPSPLSQLLGSVLAVLKTIKVGEEVIRTFVSMMIQNISAQNVEKILAALREGIARLEKLRPS